VGVDVAGGFFSTIKEKSNHNINTTHTIHSR
jgi:hypothetical protein